MSLLPRTPIILFRPLIGPGSLSGSSLMKSAWKIAHRFFGVFAPCGLISLQKRRSRRTVTTGDSIEAAPVTYLIAPSAIPRASLLR